VTFDKIAVHRLRVPLLVPYRLAFGPVEAFDTVIAEVTDRDGNSGFGEATILTGYTDETIEGCWQEAQRAAGELVALDESAAAKAVSKLGVKFPFTATAFGTAIEMMNGSELLKLPEPASVPILGLLNAKDEAAMEAEIPKLLDAGFRTIKVKVGFDFAEDIKLVKTVQKVMKGRARIRLDANQGYTAEQGAQMVKGLDPEGVELFEQPCAAGDWDSHMAVVKNSPVPMMLDESIYGLADIDKAAKLKAAAYIKVKLMKLVTLEALAAAIARIREMGMQPVLGNGVACDLGCWMEACIAVRQIDTAGEMNGFLKARSPLLKGGLEFKNGAIVLAPGFMPQLDASALRAYRVDSMVCTRNSVSQGIA
jgi:L-alanine-DL-glutamate epimerase-like enolase superfamily enzyme